MAEDLGYRSFFPLLLDKLLNEGLREMVHAPMMLMQAMAVLGMLSVLLLMDRGRMRSVIWSHLRYGLLLGLIGFLLALMASPMIQSPSKPYLSPNLPFLAGLLGSWIGGGVCWVLVVLGRLIFAGVTNIGVASLDLGAMTLAGVLLHHWLSRKSIQALTWTDVLLVWGVRTATGLGSTTVLGLLEWVSLDTSIRVMAFRLVYIWLPLLLVSGVFVLFQRDAFLRAEERAQALRLRTDMLSGLPNRRALRESLDVLLADGPARRHTLVTVEVANLDELVLAHGHDWSDGFWLDLERRLHDQSLSVLLGRSPTAVCMFSDLTLAVVLADVGLDEVVREDRLPHLLVELHEQLRTTWPVPPPRLLLGATGLCAEASDDTASVLRNLSLALQGSRQPVRYFDRSLTQKALLDDHLRRMVMAWIGSGHPPLRYQPKYDLHSGHLHGAEALLRAQDPKGHDVPPPQVIDMATRCQLLAGFEWSTVVAVVRDLAHAQDVGQNMHLAVNVSAASLVVPHFGARVVSLLQSRAVPGHRLSVEVTEATPVPDIEDVRDNLHHLVSAGVQLSLDDFGTGYSALTLLARFPFNEIKIDQWMVARLEQPRMEAAIGVAIETARRYGATLVAEGVETEQQRHRLQAMGVRIGQGFLLSRPIPFAQLLELSVAGAVPEALQDRGSLAAGTSADTVPCAMHTW